MEDSILTSTKQLLGIASDDTSFDVDVITQINTAFSDLADIGVGPPDGFMIEDEAAVWSDFITSTYNPYNSVQTLVFLKARLYFDPPQTSYLQQAMKDQIQEIEARLVGRREERDWVAPV